MSEDVPTAEGRVVTRDPGLGELIVDRENGTDGDDTMWGGPDGDRLNGGDGDDSIFGGDGGDMLNGGDGNDVVSGGEEGDELRGGRDNDTVAGGGGSDFLKGDAGDDVVAGGEGDDVILGGAGNDTMEGGAGRDLFVIEADSGVDAITDFDVANEVLNLSEIADSIDDLSIAQEGANFVIGVGESVIILENVNYADLGADNFLF